MLLLFRFGNASKRYQEKKVNINGLKLRIPDGLSFAWQYYEIFYKEYYRFTSSTDTPRILDCGANVGLSCLYYLKQHPKAQITAFEASPYVGKFLNNNLKQNGGKHVEVVMSAVWVHDKGIKLIEDKSDNSSISETEGIAVPSIRLKDYLAKEQKVDFLKMDIEGAEIDVIKDIQSQLHKIDRFFIEYHSFIDGKQELSSILRLLEEAGFRYHLENARNQTAPFEGVKRSGDMDLQINLFAWRNP